MVGGVKTGCTGLGGGGVGTGLGGSTGLAGLGLGGSGGFNGSGGFGGGGGGSAWLMAITGTTTSTMRCSKPWCKAPSATKWKTTTVATMAEVREKFNAYVLQFSLEYNLSNQPKNNFFLC